jgi:hypothetical protein
MMSRSLEDPQAIGSLEEPLLNADEAAQLLHVPPGARSMSLFALGICHT